MVEPLLPPPPDGEETLKSLPSFNALKSFEATARLNSFSAAGLELNVSRVAVSRMVARLEEALEFKLFRRHGRNLALTALGLRYYREVAPHLRAVARASKRIRRDGELSELELCVSTAFGVHWLLPRLQDFHERHPEIEIRLHSTNSLADFDARDYDAAVAVGDGDTEFSTAIDLVNEPLLAIERLPVGAPRLLRQKPVTNPVDLANHVLLHVDQSSELWTEWATSVARHRKDSELMRLARDGRFREGPKFDGLSAALQAATHGAGLLICATVVAAHEQEEGRLAWAFPYAQLSTLSYRFVYRRSLRQARSLRLFRDWLNETAERFRQGRPELYVDRSTVQRTDGSSLRRR